MQPQKPEATAKLSPGEIFSFVTVRVNSQGEIVHRETKQACCYRQNLSPGVDLEMVSIPAGSFLMGSPTGEGTDAEKPQHLVNVPAFYLGKYPITQKQYLAVMGENPSNFQGDDLPVERVSWLDAQSFCDRLNQQTGKSYRLPSEAEWEYACRAGTTTPFHFGEKMTTDLANFSGNHPSGDAPTGKCLDETTPVDGYKFANNFGLYDLHGNVYEWCLDEWTDNYRDTPTDGSASGEINSQESYRIRLLRGGSWYGNPWDCRSACRESSSAFDWDSLIGFRVIHPQDS
jgi:formylglycine-generating enzyme required for sulfatase activity